MNDIKTVGEFSAKICFHKEVEVEIPVKVVDENAAPAKVEETPAEAAPVAEEAPAAE